MFLKGLQILVMCRNKEHYQSDDTIRGFYTDLKLATVKTRSDNVMFLLFSLIYVAHLALQFPDRLTQCAKVQVFPSLV